MMRSRTRRISISGQETGCVNVSDVWNAEFFMYAAPQPL